jgi:hypothetical protein
VRKYRKKSVEDAPVVVDDVQPEAAVVETPVDVVEEPKPVVARVRPQGSAPNTVEHGSGGVFRSTGDGRRIRLR